MPSTLTTEPIGPRSVDEMLDVVYGRATRLRRRRTMQRAGGAAAAIALALGTVVSLGNGTDEARVRVVDERGRENEAPPPDEPAAAHEPPPATGDGSNLGARSGGAAPRPTPPPPKPGAPAEADAKGAVPSLPAQNAAPSVELWAVAEDAQGDAVPGDWYYDVVSASMEYDGTARVVFTTRYRTPDAPAGETRDTRILESTFNYGSHAYAVTVQESGNRLGAVHFETEQGDECEGCTARFDVDAATLVVSVPLAELNVEIARHDDSAPLGSGSQVTNFVVATSPIESPVKADISGQGRL